MYKEILFGEEARKKILKGVNIVADAVVTTIGPKGQHVIFEETIYPTVTKDGVTVAQQVMLEDSFESMGVMAAREAAENTNREAGDGTSNTIVLTREIANDGNRLISMGMNPILLKRGMDIAVDDILEELKKFTKDVTTKAEKINVASISANNDDKLGKLIAEVVEETGANGIVTVTSSNNSKTSVEYVKGTRIDSGYGSHYFINDKKKLSAELENPSIIITTDKITMESQLVKVLQKGLSNSLRKFVLIAPAIEDSALAFLVKNHMLGKFTCVPVTMTSFGEYQRDMMYDLATVTEGIVLGDDAERKLDEAEIDDFGTAELVSITRDNTILTGTNGDISKNIDEVKALLDAEEDTFLIEKLKERLGKLTGSVANIKVGGATETEQTETKYRIEDALNATKSAVEDGIVEGGGVALLKISKNLKYKGKKVEEYIAGYDIVRKALTMPSKQILKNAGEPYDIIVEKIKEEGNGFNALTGKFCDMFKEGIIDPVRCVRNELVNAVSSAGTLLTSEVAITNKKDGTNN